MTSASDGTIDVAAEWPGRIAEVNVRVGDAVTEGHELIVIESMKMLLPVPSPASGTVSDILIAIDEFVSEGQLLIRIDSG